MAASIRRASRLLAEFSRVGSVGQAHAAAALSATHCEAQLGARRVAGGWHFTAADSTSSWRWAPPTGCRAYGARTAVDEQVDRINELFAEAREEIENAKEDAETVYFNESAEAAKAAVEEVLGAWGGLLEGLGEEERAKMVRSMGLKMEQLKAELKGLEELHA